MADTTGWKVTSQVTDQTQVDAAGNTITGVVVYFTTGDGNQGNVFVPNRLYTARHVATIKTMIRDAATLLDQVGGLAENFG